MSNDYHTNSQQNIKWIDTITDYPIAYGVAISIVGILIASLIFSVSEWLGYAVMIIMAIANGIAIRYAYNCFKEGFYDELKLFTSFAAVISIWLVWAFVAGFTYVYGVFIGILACADAICFIYIACSHFREQDTQKGAISVLVCALLLFFAYIVYPFNSSNTHQTCNNTKSVKTLKRDDIENTHWKGSWIGNIPTYIAFKENGIVIVQIGDKQRIGKYSKIGKGVTLLINGGDEPLNFSLQGNKLILNFYSEQYTFTQY